MRYQVLLLDIPKDFFYFLKYKFQSIDVDFTIAISLLDVANLCAQQQFHLLLLGHSDNAQFYEYLVAVRRISYAPIVVFLDTYSTTAACAALQSGADLCVDTNWPINLTADHIMAQFRRYTAYNHREEHREQDFQIGDIYIDPSRHVVQVKGQNVELRPREFRLLLYFMRNPNRILTAEQICEKAWGTEGIYGRGIAQPIRLLRQAIEPDPQHPVYIETVRMVGYRFTAKSVEYCDICDNSVS